MMSRTGTSRSILGISKKVRELKTRRQTEKVDFRWLAKARRICASGALRKRQHRKIVSLSPYVEEPLNSKVIKVRTWTEKSLRVFRISRFLCSKFSICGHEHSMSISHIAVSGYDTLGVIFFLFLFFKLVLLSLYHFI